LPSILKRFSKIIAADYELPLADDLVVADEQEKEPVPLPDDLPEEPEQAPEDEGEAEAAPSPEEELISFAQVQADAILKDARREAEEYKAQVQEEFEKEKAAALSAAKKEGYAAGYAEGMASANAEAKAELNRLAQDQVDAVAKFLDEAVQMRDQFLDDSREELKDLALAIAEKVIRVSLRSSSDILMRMVDAATDTHKRCEWVHIYIADCDVQGKANAIPQLTAALRRLSARVKVIPMADDESGTCIVEMPDVIIDASVSTQLGSIREVLSNAAMDKDVG